MNMLLSVLDPNCIIDLLATVKYFCMAHQMDLLACGTAGQTCDGFDVVYEHSTFEMLHCSIILSADDSEPARALKRKFQNHLRLLYADSRQLQSGEITLKFDILILSLT